MVGCVLSWAAYSALGKRVLRHAGALPATARAVWWGTLFLTVAVVLRLGSRLPAAVVLLGHPGPLLGIGYLSLVCTVFGFVAWYRGLAATDVSGASVFLNLVPLSTLAIASLALGERPSLVQLAGGLLVLGGVAVVSVLGSRRARRSGPSPS
jgi:drug/metabolite transporter (DMT)-like permease